ncbi:class IV aminotransferase [alpha proteobacterium IMCC14465]|uniref:Probable branched-chain-amino-acid aminotransferase n=1 Tax=alpha proteobacterium IMCC14465 TaxID=1220535 RepID=J9DIH2_9PROT|nr:class IV aminotransferase [alpha proteobacterium IMCC14465]
MTRIAYVDGAYLPFDEAGVHIEDRGYQFADGVYEVFALIDGHMLDVDAHLKRLDLSLEKISLVSPVSRPALLVILNETIRANNIKNGLVYMQITRGRAARNHAYPKTLHPVLSVTVRPMNETYRDHVAQSGIKVISLDDQRWKRCDIKSISLLPNVMAKQVAVEAGAQEAWMIDEAGLVTEGSSTTAWIVDAAGKLRTRPLANDILDGITRQMLFKLVDELKLELDETPFTIDEAYASKEAFSTASSLIVMPVVDIDGHKIGDGTPGPVTTKLLQSYKISNS